MNSCDMLDGWRHWQTLYQLEVFGPDGVLQIFGVLILALEDLKVFKGTLGKVNLYEGIAASDLVHLIKGKTSWDFVGISGNYQNL